jgi:hypothetical protein
MTDLLGGSLVEMGDSI